MDEQEGQQPAPEGSENAARERSPPADYEGRSAKRARRDVHPLLAGLAPGVTPGARKVLRKPPQRSLAKYKANVRPLESFWAPTGDKVLIVGDKDEQRRRCRIYTKKQHQAEFGRRTKEEYKPLLKLFKSLVLEKAYLRARQFYKENGAGFDGLMGSYGLPPAEPGGPMEHHGIRSLPHVIVEGADGKLGMGLWHTSGDIIDQGRWRPSDDIVGQKDELAEWAEKYGKEKLYKRQRDGSYKGLDNRSLSANWSAAADFMVMEGWPRVAVRVGDDRYVDIRTPYIARESTELLILSRCGNFYHSPQQLKSADPAHYEEMMREVGLSPDLADRRQEVGPERLLSNGKYELLCGKAYDEAAKDAPEERKLVQLQTVGGTPTNYYMRILEFLDEGRRIIGEHAGLNDENRDAATIEDRAKAMMNAIRTFLRRERERNRAPVR